MTEFTYEDFLKTKIPYLEVLDFLENGLTYTQAADLMQKQAEEVGFDAKSFRKILREVKAEHERNERRLQLIGTDDLDPEQFLTDDGKAVVDAKIVNFLLDRLDIVNLNGRILAYTDGYYQNYDDKIKSIISKLIPDRLRKARTITGIFELLRIDAPHKQYDQMNQQPKSMICFRDCMLDAKTLERYDHSPHFLCTNQIAHNAPDLTARPTDRITANWMNWAVPDPADREILLAFAGLCMTTDVSFEVFLLLEGDGGNGKSVFLNNVSCAIGNAESNISNVPLDKLLSNRFSTAQLLGKVANICGDLKSRAIPDSTEVKLLTGEDGCNVEFKGQDSFSIHLYSKLLFSINGLPIIEDDKSGAFFRRLRVVRFKRKPDRVDTTLGQKLQNDIDWFIWHAVHALNRAYHTADGRFTNSPNSIAAVQQMRNDSDTVAAWLSDCIVVDRNAKNRTPRSEWYRLYQNYCEKADRVACKKNEFNRRMSPYERKVGVLCYPDLRWKPDAEYSPLSP